MRLLLQHKPNFVEMRLTTNLAPRDLLYECVDVTVTENNKFGQTATRGMSYTVTSKILFAVTAESKVWIFSYIVCKSYFPSKNRLTSVRRWYQRCCTAQSRECTFSTSAFAFLILLSLCIYFLSFFFTHVSIL